MSFEGAIAKSVIVFLWVSESKMLSRILRVELREWFLESALRKTENPRSKKKKNIP